MTARFQRVTETARRALTLAVDGADVHALEGDTLLTAILCSGGALRESEFGGGRRAGFCLMAACQDCWVWTESGARLRACDTPAAAGLRILTRQPDESWANSVSQ